jgi:hypothetical protein
MNLTGKSMRDFTHCFLKIVIFLAGFLLATGPVLGQLSPGIESAAKVIDFTKFSMVGQDPQLQEHVLASQRYETGGGVEKVYGELVAKLKGEGWQELAGAYVTPATANGSFTKLGYVINVAVMMGAKERVQVQCMNLGNVEWSKLPLPKTFKSVIVMPNMAMYQNDQDVDTTKSALGESFVADGWEPFGEVIGSIYFRRNGTKLMAMVTAAPAQGGKTMIQLTAEQLSYELPVPPEITRLQYTDSQGMMSLDTKLSQENLWSFYRQALSPQWQPTTENFVRIRNEDHLIFRNEAGELIEVAIFDFEGVTRAEVTYQTAAQVAALNDAAKVAASEAKAKQEMEQAKKAAKEETELVVKLPKGTKVEESDEKSCEITAASGNGRRLAEAIVGGLVKDGWKSKTNVAVKEAGDFTLEKNGFRLNLDYTDPGFLSATIEISVFGAGKLKTVVDK